MVRSLQQRSTTLRNAKHHLFTKKKKSGAYGTNTTFGSPAIFFFKAPKLSAPFS
jgi:hypothetical protein